MLSFCSKSIPLSVCPISISYFSHCYDKTTQGSKGFVLAHDSRVQSITVEQARWEEPEADGSIASLVRKHTEVDTGSHLVFSF